MTAILGYAPPLERHSGSPFEPAKLRVWLVHDWLTGFRGGEKILLQLVRMFPQARIATLLHVPGASHPEIDARVARVSFLQRMPRARSAYRNYLPLFPWAIRSLELDGDCDLVLSVSHAVAKVIRPPEGVPHLCYCNTPMRYLWGMADHYGRAWSAKRVALAATAPFLRRFDRRTETVSCFLANSHNVARRIRRAYGREATVIHPGIDGDFFRPAPGAARENFYLALGALVPYKRIDLAVEAFVRAGGSGRALRIVGAGPEMRRLRRLARHARNITFLGHQPDEVVRWHYQHCAAFLLPGEEDFGMTPLESQACGAPVIAYRAGGACETVSDSPESRTGVFFDRQTPAALTEALTEFERIRGVFEPAALRAHALQFSWERFRAGILDAVELNLAGSEQCAAEVHDGATGVEPCVAARPCVSAQG